MNEKKCCAVISNISKKKKRIWLIPFNTRTKSLKLYQALQTDSDLPLSTIGAISGFSTPYRMDLNIIECVYELEHDRIDIEIRYTYLLSDCYVPS